ncbi:MAG TPA: ribosome biogenesis GTPase YlqF [Pseudogracilibacillus sp.]|nr:ribosome biogenesis GTPase YlqF [Pseudogracilibacillus sp.]
MIQWFPGHMAKARREMEEKLQLVDVVVELVDARAPQASENPMLHDVTRDKRKIKVLMKKDLADPSITEEWIQCFKQQQQIAIAIDVNEKSDIPKLTQLIKETGIENQRKMIEKGVKERPVRALVAGVPNVGKSTLINRFANKKIAVIGDRPGVTKKQQWIKVKNQFELLDTPGILWPKFEEPLTGTNLAIIGTIKEELIPQQDVVAHLLTYMGEHYPAFLKERYQLEMQEDMWENFTQIGKRRGALESGGIVDIDKVAELVLRDFRSGKLGRVTLERIKKEA